MMSKFNEYKTFVAVVEQGGVSKAADHLNMSVSSVSKQLSKLEAGLKARLVDRSTKSLSATEHGYEFYRRCRDILASIDDAEQNLREGLEDPVGKITLSFSNVMLKTPIMQLLRQFCNEYSNIRFDINISDRFEDLVENKIDFSIRIGELKDSRLTAIPLKKTHLVFCASPEYIQRKGKPKNYRSLFKHDVIIPTYVNLSEVAGGIFSRAITSMELNQFHTTNDYVALHEAACEGLGIIISIDLAVRKDIEEGRLVQLFTPKKIHQKELFLIYHQREYMSEKMRIFKQYIKDNTHDFLA